jgi:lipoprotein-anchoring transpeptidase ErfK/SrfK
LTLVHRRLRLALVSFLALAGAACSSAAPAASERTTPTPATAVAGKVSATLRGFSSYAASVVGAEVAVADDPGGTTARTLSARTKNGTPTTLLVLDEREVGAGVWYRVQLPVKPNGTTGWVRATNVQVSGLRHRLVIDRNSFTMDLLEDERVVRTFEIGVGTDETPTPDGTYYVTELLRPPDQNTTYGHYVFALSGFSEVLEDWPDGGVLGIHGTNDPDGSIGRKVSHGCIRLRNEDVAQLATMLPLGTPVTVEA